MSISIREYVGDTDYAGLRECVVSLQDYEYEIDDRFPNGEQIADEYIPDVLYRCKLYAGNVFVAERDGEIAGYVMVWTRFKTDDVEDGDFVCGLVADLAVLERHRGHGLGAALLEFAEHHARSNGVKYLRLGVMAQNEFARRLYERKGYRECHVDLEKCLGNEE